MTLREQSMVFKALGYPVRLAPGECCVCELQELSGVRRVSGPTVSQHLWVLVLGFLDLGRRPVNETECHFMIH